MSPLSDSAQHPGSVLARFFERAQGYSFHELRGRIGTIANFASVLEAGRASSSETVEIARRIRISALTAARMMQLLGSAIELAGRPLRQRSTDLQRLAQSILTEAGGRGTVHCASPDPVADVDADLVAFVWRAFVALQNDAAGGPIRGSSLSVTSTPRGWELALHRGTDASTADEPDAAETDVQSYVHQNAGNARLENGLALTLAHHLVASHEGRLALRGRPGGRTSLLLVLPATETAAL